MEIGLTITDASENLSFYVTMLEGMWEREWERFEIITKILILNKKNIFVKAYTHSYGIYAAIKVNDINWVYNVRAFKKWNFSSSMVSILGVISFLWQWKFINFLGQYCEFFFFIEYQQNFYSIFVIHFFVFTWNIK